MASTCIYSITPGFVEVTFPKVFLDGSTVNPLNPPVFVVKVLIGQVVGSGAKGHPGGKTLHNTTPAYFPSQAESTPINELDLNALAQKLAGDFYNYQTTSHDFVLNGIVNWLPEGLTDCLEFTYDANDLTTRVMTGPINSYPEEFMHHEYLGQGSSSDQPSQSGQPSESPSQSQSGSEEPSSSSCIYFDGPLTLLQDVQCVNGKIKIYKIRLTFDCGFLKETNDPYYDHDAGCCDCDGGGGVSGGGESGL